MLPDRVSSPGPLTYESDALPFAIRGPKVFVSLIQFVRNLRKYLVKRAPAGCINSLTSKKQSTKFASANFKKMLSPSYIILRTQRLEGKSVDLDEVAHYEPLHQDLYCFSYFRLWYL